MPVQPLRFLASAALAGFVALSSPLAALAETITVHKTPWCGCCSAWVEHLREAGFEVEVEEAEDLAPYRVALGVPDQLMSCHTAEVDGYAIEGHVPAEEIKRLLVERPDARGLSVPGMPMGSPGMETPYEPDTYDVVIFSDDGAAVFASYAGANKISLTEE